METVKAADMARLLLIKSIASGEEQHFRGKKIASKTEALGIIWVEASLLISALSIAAPPEAETQG